MCRPDQAQKRKEMDRVWLKGEPQYLEDKSGRAAQGANKDSYLYKKRY